MVKQRTCSGLSLLLASSDKKLIRLSKGVTAIDGVSTLKGERYRMVLKYTLKVRVDDEYAFTRRVEASYVSLENDDDLDFDGRLRDFDNKAGQSVRIGADVVKKNDVAHIEGGAWLDDGDGLRNSTEHSLEASIELQCYSGYPNSNARSNSKGMYSIDVVPVPGEVLYIHVDTRKYKSTKKLNEHFLGSSIDSDVDSNRCCSHRCCQRGD